MPTNGQKSKEYARVLRELTWLGRTLRASCGLSYQRAPADVGECRRMSENVGGCPAGRTLRRSELERQGKLLSLSPQSFQEARLIREFAYHVDGILYFLKDVLLPRKLEVHLDNGFEAVRETLRRRVG